MRIATTKMVAASAVLLLNAVILSGCSNGAGSGGSAPGSKVTGAKIGFLLPNIEAPRYEALDRPLFESAVKQLCADCEILYANALSDAAKQQQQAEAMLTQGAKVLVLDSTDTEAGAAIAAEAKAKKVPVISYSRLTNSADLSYFVSFEIQKIGEMGAQALLDELKKEGIEPGNGGILLANGAPNDSAAMEYKVGVHKIIDPSGYKILSEFDSPDWSAPKTLDWLSGQITRFHSQIKGVYGANDTLAAGIIAALKGAGLTKIPVTGGDGTLSAVQLVLAGDQLVTVYSPIKPLATKSAQLAIDLIQGKAPKGETVVKTPGGAEVQSFLMQSIAVTADKVESTIVKDGVYKVSDICTPTYAAACAKAGIK